MNIKCSSIQLVRQKGGKREHHAKWYAKTEYSKPNHYAFFKSSKKKGVEMFYEEIIDGKLSIDSMEDPLGAIIEHLKVLGAEAICNVAEQAIQGKPMCSVSPKTASEILRLHESAPGTHPVTAIDEGFKATSLHDPRYLPALYHALSGKPDEEEEFLWNVLKLAEHLYDGLGTTHLVDDQGLVIIDLDYLHKQCADDNLEADPYEEFIGVVDELTDWLHDALEEAYLVTVTYDMAMKKGLSWSVARVALSLLRNDITHDACCDAYLTRAGLTVLNLDRLDYMAHKD